ncbi:J domain-containing protein [Paludisphaera sp.]|uniref:J domain-containing protein n=1 Tax=Paludisphaera sp. TaxID=2017432 RepID=UPI00301C86E0
MFVTRRHDRDAGTIRLGLAEAYRKRVRFHFRELLDLGTHSYPGAVDDHRRDVETAAALFPEHRHVFPKDDRTGRLTIDMGSRFIPMPAWMAIARAVNERQDVRDALRRWEESIGELFGDWRDRPAMDLRSAWRDYHAGASGIPRPWRDAADAIYYARNMPRWLIVKPDSLKTLGLKGDATAEDVKAAYRRLARENHPDRGGDVASMARINEAYEQAMKTVRRA